MDLLGKLERLAPQWFLAAIAIFGAVAFMFYYDPPHSLCSTQRRAFYVQQRKFLASSAYDKFFERCLLSNSRGGCEPYFSGFKKVLDDFKVIDSQCHEVVARTRRLRSALSAFLFQTARLAWGDEGPETIHKRGRWFSSSHYRTFCRVKSQYQRSYGLGAYESLVARSLKTLPTKKRRLTRVQKKDRSLFGTPCSRYF